MIYSLPVHSHNAPGGRHDGAHFVTRTLGTQMAAWVRQQRSVSTERQPLGWLHSDVIAAPQGRATKEICGFVTRNHDHSKMSIINVFLTQNRCTRQVSYRPALYETLKYIETIVCEFEFDIVGWQFRNNNNNRSCSSNLTPLLLLYYIRTHRMVNNPFLNVS